MNESTLLAQVSEIHERKTNARLARAERELAAAQKAGGERVFFGDSESGGAVSAMMHPTHKHIIGQRLGYDALDDPSVRRDYLKEFPAARVRSRPAAPVFRMPAKPWTPQEVPGFVQVRGFRFRKSYR